MRVKHGKIPEWYNKDSEQYDTFNEANSKTTNETIEKKLKEHKVQTVVDLTCGTGSQVFWLTKAGFTVTGSDISPGMLKIARNKAQKAKLNIEFRQGDMRFTKIGKFDAALSIFNAVGHLTKIGFEKAMRNIYQNLNEDGLYIFDIFNLNYFANTNNISKLTIDWVRTLGSAQLREIQYSILDRKGVLISYSTIYTQDSSKSPRISKITGTLQLYTAQELTKMLERNGFIVLEQCEMDGSPFSENSSERIMTIAKKRMLDQGA